MKKLTLGLIIGGSVVGLGAIGGFALWLAKKLEAKKSFEEFEIEFFNEVEDVEEPVKKRMHGGYRWPQIRFSRMTVSCRKGRRYSRLRDFRHVVPKRKSARR